MEALLDRTHPPEHIVIETSGLALPKPLVKAFDWPAIRTRVTVDGVVAVIDAAALAEGRFAEDPAKLGAQRQADAAIDHDNPLEEVFEDQVLCADLIVLNKTDLLDAAALARVTAEIEAILTRGTKILAAVEGRIDPAILLGLDASAEDDLAGRPSHHDGEAGHDHDDFESFVLDVPPVADPAVLVDRLAGMARRHDVLRLKGFLAIREKPMRLLVQGVGGRLRHHYDRAWAPGEARRGRLVVIGRKGLDRAAIAADVAA
jgi:cobalamin biosynthesis protein CobW